MFECVQKGVDYKLVFICFFFYISIFMVDNEGVNQRLEQNEYIELKSKNEIYKLFIFNFFILEMGKEYQFIYINQIIYGNQNYCKVFVFIFQILDLKNFF